MEGGWGEDMIQFAQQQAEEQLKNQSPRTDIGIYCTYCVAYFTTSSRNQTYDLCHTSWMIPAKDCDISAVLSTCVTLT